MLRLYADRYADSFYLACACAVLTAGHGGGFVVGDTNCYIGIFVHCIQEPVMPL